MTDDTSSFDNLRRVVTEMIVGLKTSGATPGVAIGEKAPSFVLPNANGKPVSLDDRLLEGPVVVVFYRGAWCPYCDTHLRAFQASIDAIEAHGASVIAISPQAPDASLSLSERLALRFEVLSDLDQSVSAAWHLKFPLSDDVRAAYSSMGLSLEEHNADGTWHLPVPATFVLDQAGIVRARHVDPNYLERMPINEVLDALAAIAR